MAENKLKVQNFRINDLSEDTGKQFELGKTWCEFFEIDDSVNEITFNLEFMPISKAHEHLKNKQIELKLSGLTPRKDRKAYVNGSDRSYSAIKEFFIKDLQLNYQNNSNDYFAIYKFSKSNYYLYYIPQLLHDNFIKFFENSNPTITINHASNTENSNDKSIQQIFYGAPGTGKSNTIKRDVDDKGKLNFRTTFHPDSDYSTFVGCYKPTMKRSTITKDDVTTTEEKIVYKFEPQAFTNAYVQAWNSKEDVYLIIEEINRGNCAQIFGDLFQLLDRKNGESEYPVNAESALADYLSIALSNTDRDDIPSEVKNGTKLKFPSNLYIWATMNTSDQSLFPIDSAFKRRWEWKYIKIKDEGKNWKIDVKTKNNDGEDVFVDWWNFIRKINEIIASMTSSADKQLGYFFCKADKKTQSSNNENDLISMETLVNKVLFYLWNDVFKDYGFEDVSLFQYIAKAENGKEIKKDISFPDFYEEDSNEVNFKMVTDFVQKVMNWEKTE